MVKNNLMKSGRSMIFVAIIAALVGFALVAFLLQRGGAPEGRDDAPAAQTQTARETDRDGETTERATTERATGRRDDAEAEAGSIISQMFNGETGNGSMPGRKDDWLTTFASVTIRLTLAALLSAMLAFRPRRFALFFKRNPFVAQTQILLAVVASALMMIVGDSAARAFGIFAAVSLVRFRTNIKDPKEITVLLVSLAIGLATGVGRWELALILAFFVLLLLWGLEYREPELVFRSMELSVKSRNVDATQEMLLALFRKYGFEAEVRTIDRPDGEGELGAIIYNVNVSPFISTDRLSDEILAADPRHIDTVEWDQQKNKSYFYQ